jgi:hypothetical protein
MNILLLITAPLPIFSLLRFRQWLKSVEINNLFLARYLCKVIPASCPFERKIKVFQYILVIPPLCKLNPFYEQLMLLRLKSLVYLSEKCGENSKLCC